MRALWLRFFKEVSESLRRLPAELQENEYISQAAELCKESAFTPAELAAYDKYWDIVRTERALIESSRMQGEAKGRAEEKSAIAKKMKAQGIPFEQIAVFTDLPLHEIEQLTTDN